MASPVTATGDAIASVVWHATGGDSMTSSNKKVPTGRAFAGVMRLGFALTVLTLFWLFQRDFAVGYVKQDEGAASSSTDPVHLPLQQSHMATVPSAAMGRVPALAGFRVDVAFRSEDGTAVANVRFAIRPAASAWRWRSDQPPWSYASYIAPPIHVGVSSNQGTASFELGVPGEFRVEVQDPHWFLLAPALFAVGDGAVVVQVRVTAGSSLVGRVTDRAGRGLPGVAVAAMRRSFLAAMSGQGASIPLDSPENFAFTRTGDGGFYRLDGIPGGRSTTVAAVGERWAPATVVVEVGEPLSDLLVPDLVVDGGGTIALAVQWSAAPMQPAPIDVTMYPRRENLFNMELTRRLAAEGVVRVAQLAPGDYRVVIRCDGFVPIETNVEVVDGEEVRHRFVLACAVGLRGAVVDATGAPLAGAKVTIEQGGIEQTCMTSVDGGFGSRSMDVGRAYVRADLEGYVATAAQEVQVAIGGSDVALVMRRGAKCFGQVRDASGAPVVDCAVTLEHKSRSSWPPGRMWCERTKADGRFLFVGLPDGAYSLTGRTSAMSSVSVEVVITAATDQRQDLALVRNRMARGRVVEEGSHVPLVGATVEAGNDDRTNAFSELLLPGLDSGSVRTEVDGRFAVPVARTATQLTIRAHGSPPTEVSLPDSHGDDLDLGDVVVRQGGSVFGILSSGGAPWDRGGTSVILRGVDESLGKIGYGAVQPDGRFGVKGLVAGTYVLEVCWGGTRCSAPDQRIVVRNGARLQNDIALPTLFPVRLVSRSGMRITSALRGSAIVSPGGSTGLLRVTWVAREDVAESLLDLPIGDYELTNSPEVVVVRIQGATTLTVQ
jgi:hypothetical protein